MSEARQAHLGGHANRRIDAIVIGGSAGVLEVLRDIFAALPHTLPIPVLVVVHLPPRSNSQVHHALQPATPLLMSQAEDKEPLQGGRIYFAPAGYHFLVEGDRCAALSIDEPVFYSRPAIDVLFESSSDVYRGALLGILLTGASADGAAGLQTIHARGGITVVQRPDTCEASAMPQAALELFEPDFVLAPNEIGALLSTLSTSPKLHSHD
jgi:two-component system, chemotaxis family, protein-glutamate methylesterase/glutaminase